MGPAWLNASRMTGVYIDDKLWVNDPPSSSYPSCIAVKCAGLQSDKCGEVYLQYAREAVMVRGINIAKKESLLRIAAEVANVYPLLMNEEKFEANLASDIAMAAFKLDLQDIKYKGINRFPTLIIRSEGKPSIMITGYRPFDVLLEKISLAFVIE